MIYPLGDGKTALRFTGENILELGRLIRTSVCDKYSDLDLHSIQDAQLLKNHIALMVRGLNLRAGNWVVYDQNVDKKCTKLRTSEIHAQYPQIREFIECGVCTLETDTEFNIKVCQYNTTFDVVEIQKALGSAWSVTEIDRPPVSHCYISFIERGNAPALFYSLHHGDWIFINPSDKSFGLEIFSDDEFHCQYIQDGRTIRKICKIPSIPDSAPMPAIGSLLSIPGILGGFAPNVHYELNSHALALLGRKAKIVESKTKYLALQYNSPTVVDAIKTIYPMLNFVKDVYYKDWPTLTILMGTLPAGSIKRDEWIIFEPSSPGNPKFKIVSNEEYLEQYRISK